jgi:hypothetical protein
MSYFAYSEPIIIDQDSFIGRDTKAGILGTIKPTTQPIAEADDLETLETKAFAYLGKEPDALLHLADAEGHLYRILINEKYHKAVNGADRMLWICIALLIFCLTAFVGSEYTGVHLWYLVCFLIITLLYIIYISTGIENVIEAFLFFEILLVLSLILIPVFVKAHNKAIHTQSLHTVAYISPHPHSFVDTLW